MREFTVETRSREEMVNVTALVQEAVADSGCESGLAFCFVPHTTAAITINEDADPDVRHDILYKLGKEIPQIEDYRHAEGNSDAHIKASLIGCSEMVAFERKRLVLGRWQGIFFCEFDGPRRRRLIVRVGSFA
ncbi:MAG: secondary thiamine-phosphate synthase enzyme YjbQ [Candidatus Zixiibacteriota bacterium]